MHPLRLGILYQLANSLVVIILGLALTHAYADSKLIFPAVLDRWEAEVDGVSIVYHFVDLRGWSSLAYAKAHWPTEQCHIYLDSWLLNSRSELVNVVLHEVGHCMDLFKLDFDHNWMSWGDCSLGWHDCLPEERYAEAWREAYLDHCGTTLYPIGFPGEAVHRCGLPDPRAVATAIFPEP